MLGLHDILFRNRAGLFYLLENMAAQFISICPVFRLLDVNVEVNIDSKLYASLFSTRLFLSPARSYLFVPRLRDGLTSSWTALDFGFVFIYVFMRLHALDGFEDGIDLRIGQFR